MRLLVLGGTGFLGRHAAADALGRGHEVTLFTRGRRNPGLFPEAEHLRGDRTADLAPLAGRRWDAVLDTSGYVPRHVAASAEVLAPAVGRYAFVSSASVYRDWPARPVDEDAPTFAGDPDAGPGDGDYGTLKAGCELAVERALPGRAVHVRAGLLVGPHEDVGRLPSWLVRAARPGPLVAPGPPERPLQLIDARDAAAFVLDVLEAEGAGIYNVTAPPGTRTFGDLVDACLAAAGSGDGAAWVDEQHLLAAAVEPWTDLPFWAPATPDWSGAWAIATGRAEAAGLSTQPLAETVADTWAWLRSGEPDAALPAARVRPLPAEREAAVVAAARRAGG